MSKTEPFLEVGYSWDTPSGLLDLATDHVGSLEGIDVSRRRLGQLAGPNDVIQFISNNWGAILVLAGVPVTWAANKTLDTVWKNRSAFSEWFRAQKSKRENVLGAIRNVASSPDTTASVTVPALRSKRNVGFEVTSTDPAEIAWQLGHLAMHGQEIQEAVEFLLSNPKASVSFDENPDCSIKLTLSDDGVVTLAWRSAVDGPQTKTFRVPD